MKNWKPVAIRWLKRLLQLALFAPLLLILIYPLGFYLLLLVIVLFYEYGKQISFGVACLLALLAVVFWKKNHRRLSAAALIPCIAISLWLGYGWYREAIRVPVVNIDVTQYLPFEENSKIVRLPGEASLRLTEELPVVDGAAALVPVYSAFVNAVYPEDIPWLNSAGPDGTEGPFRYNNTVRGYKELGKKKTDVFFGAYPSKDQIDAAKKNGTTFQFTEIGREGFVFFVSRSNPVDGLTSDQIRKIYSGEITNWKEVGGRDKPIAAYQRNEGSGSQSALLRFMGDVPVMKPPMDQENDLMSGIIEDVADYRNDGGAIGFSFRYYTEEIMKNHRVKLLAVDGVKPDLANITAGSYPLTSPFYAVTWEGNPNPNVSRLLDWILSEEGQSIVERSGYAPIR